MERQRKTLKLSLFFGILFALGWFTGIGSATHLLRGPGVTFLPVLTRADGLSELPAPPPEPPRPATWLAYVNYHRALAMLPPVTESGAWSEGARQHACYMVQNDYIGHDQIAGAPCASAEGAEAAPKSNVMVSSYMDTPDSAAIDYWMQTPFHSIAILDPELGEAGFGSHRAEDEGWRMGAALDVGHGLKGQIPGNVSFPVMWPSDGATVHLRAFPGYEWPAPLASCPGFGGYETQAGLPIILQLGSGNVSPQVTGHSLTENGAPVEHCVFDETNYTNADTSQQWVGRIILNVRDAIVIMPRSPLTPGASYTASVTVNGQTHTWSFTVSGEAYIMGTDGEIQIR